MMFAHLLCILSNQIVQGPEFVKLTIMMKGSPIAKETVTYMTRAQTTALQKRLSDLSMPMIANSCCDSANFGSGLTAPACEVS